jgi:hypothetical protein
MSSGTRHFAAPAQTISGRTAYRRIRCASRSTLHIQKRVCLAWLHFPHPRSTPRLRNGAAGNTGAILRRAPELPDDVIIDRCYPKPAVAKPRGSAAGPDRPAERFGANSQNTPRLTRKAFSKMPQSPGADAGPEIIRCGGVASIGVPPHWQTGAALACPMQDRQAWARVGIACEEAASLSRRSSVCKIPTNGGIPRVSAPR